MESPATVHKPALRPDSVPGSSGRSTPPSKRVFQTWDPSVLRKNRISSPPAENRSVTGLSVNLVASPTPSARMRQILACPPRVDRKQIHRPSADHAGELSSAASFVR